MNQLKWDRMTAHILRHPSGRTLWEREFRDSELTIHEFVARHPPQTVERPAWWERVAGEVT